MLDSATGPDPERDAPAFFDMDGVRCLHFDSPWLQGAMQLRHPSRLVFLYTRQMMAWQLFLRNSQVQRIAQLGLGAGSLARYCIRHTPAQVTVVEWNPAVTACCQQYFRLPKSKRFEIIHEDAQRWVADPCQWEGFNVLQVDLYDYTAQGPVASSLAFYQHCYQVLKVGGVMAVNLFAHHPSFHKNRRRIVRAFQGRVLTLPETEDGNLIVLAFKGPRTGVAYHAFMRRALHLQRYTELEALDMAESLLPSMQSQAQAWQCSNNELAF